MKRYTQEDGNKFRADPEGEWIKAEDALAIDTEREALAEFAAHIYQRAADVSEDGSSRNWTGLRLAALSAPVAFPRSTTRPHQPGTDNDALTAHLGRLRSLGWRAQSQLAANGQVELSCELADALGEMPDLSLARLAEQAVESLLAEVWQEDLYSSAEELKGALRGAARHRRLLAERRGQ